MSAIVVNDEVVHYEVLGRGPGILFIHGWLGSWRYWVPTMQSLSTRYRTYAIDLWGYGDSGKRPINYTIEAQMKLIERFLDQLGVTKMAIVGHGLGGAVSLRFAAQHPEMVARLMTIATPLNGAAINPRMRNDAVTSLLDWLLGKGPDAESISAEAKKIDPNVIAISVEDMATMDFTVGLGVLTAPTLLVHGEKDIAITPPADDWTNGGQANVHRISFEGGKHFPMLDDPAKFNRLLADFLEAKDLTSLELKDEWKRRIR
ncbi:MAG: alpha/beta hydrolase [Chloroflexi bacterium]|nr:alpha/beta hydrolase [Chloroflexota bacterium]